MSDWHDESPNRRDGVTIPTIWVAIALSLLIHAAALWEWLPKLRLPSPEETKRGEASGSLVVRLAPPPSLPAAPPHSPALNDYWIAPTTLLYLEVGPSSCAN